MKFNQSEQYVVSGKMMQEIYNTLDARRFVDCGDGDEGNDYDVLSLIADLKQAFPSAA